MTASSARSLRGSGDWRLHTPDEVLLRRFGLVRVVGAIVYTIAALSMLALVGARAWPLAIGVPVLAAATLAYVRWSEAAPRAAVAASLAVDAAVLAGAIGFIGGAGSGLVMLYSIVVVSAGILLGRSAAVAFTAATTLLGLGQLLVEEAWNVAPVVLGQPAPGERRLILLLSLAGLVSVGYLSATYASRLHELIAIAGAEAEIARGLGRRRRAFVEQTVLDARVPLGEIEDIADALAAPAADFGADERAHAAARLRVLAAQLGTKVETLGQAGALGAAHHRPEPVLLRSVVDDCLTALDGQLVDHAVEVDMPPLKALGERRAIRRAVLSVLENVAVHTPPGTRAHVTAVADAGQAVLVVTDDGPGIPDAKAMTLFEPAGGQPLHVGLPLVRELCEAMGGGVRYERTASGGARFMLALRLAPRNAPSDDDPASPERPAAGP